MYTFEWKQIAKDVSFTDTNGALVSKTIAPKFEGSVTLKVPRHVDRIKVIRSLSTKIDESGELVKSGMDSAEKLMDFAKAQIESVNLKRIDDGLEIKTVEWLEYDVDGAEILSEISNTLIQGIKLGKS